LFAGLPSGTRVSYDAARLHYDGVRLRSPFHFTRGAVARARALLLDGSIDVRRLISAQYPLERVADAFAALDRGEGMKFAIVPGQAQALEAA
jgi:threonine dehydrogenase-like Zn-dependent dehydrogenase